MKTMESRNLSPLKRGLSFEMIMWIFTRLSALAMHAFFLIGAIGALIMGARSQMSFADLMRWGFMPNVTHVQNTNVPDLTPWASPFWKLFACLFLLVAAAHGIHGLVVVLDDYFAQPRVRQIVRVFSIVFLLAIGGMGVYVIWTS